MKWPYRKMHGCRNDYIYLDFLKGQPQGLDQIAWPDFSRTLADRSKGLGADGLILLWPPEDPAKADARMKMYNADGSEAEMCGNGIRCLAKILYDDHGQKSSYRIETKAGVRECCLISTEDSTCYQVQVNMGRPTFIPAKIPVEFPDVMVMNEEFEVDDQLFRVSCVSMGNPHCVIEVKDLENFDVARYGPQIEKHEVFPQGVNVEFIERKEMDVYQRTWERGSGETMACGTGACAVAVSLILRNRLDSPVDVHLRGGSLRIEWDGLREVWMTGEAVEELKAELALPIQQTLS